jgi:hypothetical protein
MPRQRRLHSAGLLLPQHGAALDIGEEKGDADGAAGFHLTLRALA